MERGRGGGERRREMRLDGEMERRKFVGGGGGRCYLAEKWKEEVEGRREGWR